MNKRIFLAIFIILLMGACQLPQDNPLPEGKPGALYTEAALTLSVQMTQEDLSTPGTTQPPGSNKTPLPPSPTLFVPTDTPDNEDQDSSKACDQVKFIKDVTIPDDMDLEPGEKFTKTWRIQNAGSCSWSIGYLLYFESGELMDGPSSQELTSETILPGEMIDISVDLVAPLEIGAYQGNWKLRNVKGDSFGVGEFSKPFWVKINVVEGAGLMRDLKAKTGDAVWGSGKTPVDFIDLGGNILNLDEQDSPSDPFVAIMDQQPLEGGRVSGVVLATYPPAGKGSYIIGRFPDYKVNGGDLLFGRVGLTAVANGNCSDGDVDFRIHLMQNGDPSTLVMLWEWNEVCDRKMKSFEVDLDGFKGETVQIFLIVVSNNNSSENKAVWDVISIHR
jgi:hypothetical protein